VFVDELGLLIGPAIFVVNDSTEVYVRQTEDAKIFLVVRRGWQLWINRRSVTEEVRERETHGTATSRQNSQRVYICCEISTLAQLISIACLQFAFPHVAYKLINIYK